MIGRRALLGGAATLAAPLVAARGARAQYFPQDQLPELDNCFAQIVLKMCRHLKRFPKQNHLA